MDRTTKAAITIFVIVVIFIMMLAAYGYFGGMWETAPAS